MARVGAVPALGISHAQGGDGWERYIGEQWGIPR